MYKRQGHKTARVSAVFGIVGWVDVPIVFMSVRWWRTIHPTVITANAINLDSRMTIVLMFSLFAITLVYAFLLIVRYRQLDLTSRIERLRHQHLMR